KSVKKSDDLDGKYGYKIEQLKMYMAGLPSTSGRLKIIEVAGRPPTEHTWNLGLDPLDLAHVRIATINRKDVLMRALATGSLIQILKLKHIYAPILKSSFCADETGFCKEIKMLRNETYRRKWQTGWREWLTLVMDQNDPDNLGPTAREIRRWM